MKKLILILAVVFSFSSCTTQFQSDMESRPLTDIQIDELSDQYIKSISKNNTKTLAIMDFVNLDGSVSMLGKYLREEITLRLFKSINVSVVERGMLQEVMNEWDFGANGFVNEKTASRIGQLMGVEAITIGTISDLGDYLKINSRIIEVETGEIISVASIYLTKNSMINTLLESKPVEIIEKKEPVKTEIDQEEKVVEIQLTDKENIIKFDSQGIRFLFNKITYSKSLHTLNLEGSVVSLDSDKKLSFRPSYVNIITEIGNKYKGTYVKIARVEERVSSMMESVDLVEGIETHMIVKLENFDYTPFKIIRFQMDGWHPNSYKDNIEVSLKPNIEIEILD